MPLLDLEGVTLRYPGTLALDGVTAALDGRAVGLLGPNGAGKTTLMKVLLGLERPDSGRVTVLGLNVGTHATEVRGRLGFAAEGSGRLPGLSGLESVALAAELCGVRRRTALLRAHDMLDLVGLDEARYRPVDTYSTGMHQRVKVAMALVHDPDLVLLDEPTSGLDPQSRDELLALVVALRDGGGPAVLLSTHLLHDVERTCDACLIMARGKVRFAGRLDQLRVAAPRQWNVRLARPEPSFSERIRDLGGKSRIGDRPDAVVIDLPDGTGADLIWQAAVTVGASIVHLEPRAASLEEAFLQAIGDDAGGKR